MNLYQWLWSRIGGRPWTYIVRDTWHQYELFWIAAITALGAYAGERWGFRLVLTWLGIFTIGYIFGHFFWGTEYIENQGEK